MLVAGPYLVRGVELKNDLLQVNGDWNQQTPLEIWAPPNVKKVKFNKETLDLQRTSYGSLVSELEAPEVTVESLQASIPELNSWRYANGLPEAATDYDDSRWTGTSPV